VPLAEFLAAGYLQELNRQFLHPLGMALEVRCDDEGTPEKLGGVWDYRDDPEGMLFHESIAEEPAYAEKAAVVGSVLAARVERRRELLGFVVQPAGTLREQCREKIADHIARDLSDNWFDGLEERRWLAQHLQEYDPDLWAAVFKRLKELGRIIEVGASVGHTAALARVDFNP
jgi:hypothetical protein